MKKKLIFTVILMCIIGCNMSKEYYENGQKLEQSGMFYEARDYYLKSLKEDKDNIDAKISLKKVGFRIINKNMDQMNKYYQEQQYKKAIEIYQKTKSFVKNAQNQGVNFNIDSEYKNKYNDIVNDYCESLTQKGDNFLAQENFTEAKKLYREVLNFKPKNKNIKTKLNQAKKEPIYRIATQYLEKKEYKKSYWEFDKINDYRDAIQLKKLAQKKASTTIAFVQIDYNYNPNIGYLEVLQKKLLEHKNPFIKFAIYEKPLNFKNKQKLLEIGSKYDASSILTCKINHFHIDRNNEKRIQKKGWEAYIVTENGTKKYRYKKVFYTSIENHIEVNLKASITLTSLENRRIIFTENINTTEKDHIHYYQYKNPKALRTGHWESMEYSSYNDKVNIVNNLSNSLLNLWGSKTVVKDNNIMKKINARKNLKSTQKLIQNAVNESTTEIIKKIISF